LVLIDYPGFNLRIAEFAHDSGFKVCYYISPKLWAWNKRRALKIKRFVNQMYAILPFEKQFYHQYGYDVHYVGNPLVHVINSFKPENHFRKNLQIDDRPVIAILPGSRPQEIIQMLEIMLELVPDFPSYKFVVAAVDNVPAHYYQQARNMKEVSIITNQAYDLLTVASAAIVTSGTASLETALFNVPQIVCYKTSWLTYMVARMVIKVPYLSLVNLIAGHQVVPELIQKEYNKASVSNYLRSLLPDGPEREAQLEGYQKVKSILGNKKASRETARLITEFFDQTKQPSAY
jgi:lipid-A-disaccharide synthase